MVNATPGDSSGCSLRAVDTITAKVHAGMNRIKSRSTTHCTAQQRPRWCTSVSVLTSRPAPKRGGDDTLTWERKSTQHSPKKHGKRVRVMAAQVAGYGGCGSMHAATDTNASMVPIPRGGGSGLSWGLWAGATLAQRRDGRADRQVGKTVN